MKLGTQFKMQENDLFIDSGIELIWLLEDAYENRDINKFFSLVCLDFKKNLEDQLEKEFNQTTRINLYFHFYSKGQDFASKIYFYDICWSKRSMIHDNEFWQRDFGKATILLKKFRVHKKIRFLLFGIYGDNPFGRFID